MEGIIMAGKGSIVEFMCDGGYAAGYLIEPVGDGKYAAIIVIHEWWGLNEHIKNVANRFAESGYVTLAPDLYAGNVTKDADEAGRLMSNLDRGYALGVLNGAIEYLKTLERVDEVRIGVTGFCMGGTYALALACDSEGIKAAAPFYGDVVSDDELKKLSSPILFIGAENDFWITMDKMSGLRAKLVEFGKQGEVKIYSGVGHAFFNDTRSEVYSQEASEDAWKRVTAFFAKYLYDLG